MVLLPEAEIRSTQDHQIRQLAEREIGEHGLERDCHFDSYSRYWFAAKALFPYRYEAWQISGTLHYNAEAFAFYCGAPTDCWDEQQRAEEEDK